MQPKVPEPPRLSDEEVVRINGAVNAIANKVSGLLAGKGDAWSAASCIESMHSGVDQVVADWTPGDPAPACVAGCAFCCEALVEVSDAEALVIARHVQGLPQERQHDVLKALTEQSLQRKNLAWGAKVRCAFLEGNLCSIYSRRPATCRKAHSLSAQSCAQGDDQIPQNFLVVMRCDVLVAGTNQGYRKAGLPATRHELSAAVLSALQRAETTTQWYEGKPILPSMPGGNTPAGGVVD